MKLEIKAILLTIAKDNISNGEFPTSQNSIDVEEAEKNLAEEFNRLMQSYEDSIYEIFTLKKYLEIN